MINQLASSWARVSPEAEESLLSFSKPFHSGCDDPQHRCVCKLGPFQKGQKGFYAGGRPQKFRGNEIMGAREVELVFNICMTSSLGLSVLTKDVTMN